LIIYIYNAGFIEKTQDIEDAGKKFQSLFIIVGNSMSLHLNYVRQRANFFNDVGHTLLGLMEERLHETSTIQRRQNALLDMMIRLVSQGLPQPAQGMETLEGLEAWNNVIRQEAAAMKEAQEDRLKLLRHMRCQVDLFRKAVTPGLDEADEDFRQQVEEDMEALREELGQGGSPPADDRVMTARPSDDVDMELDELAEDRDEDDVHVKVEIAGDDGYLLAEPEEVVVPASIVGTTIDLTGAAADQQAVSSGHTHSSLDITSDTQRVPAVPSAPSNIDQQSHRPPSEPPLTPPQAPSSRTQVIDHSLSGTEPVSLDPPAIPEAVPMRPAVNLIAATPQNSQDAPAGTMTALVIPSNSSRTRSRSRSPIPPTSPMITRSRSRSRTPAPANPTLAGQM